MCLFKDYKSFKKKHCPFVVGQLLKDSNILKLIDFLKYKYALFIRNSLRKENIPIFNEFYTLFNQNHVYNTRGSTNQMLIVPQIQTTHYGEHSLNKDQSMHGICSKDT